MQLRIERDSGNQTIVFATEELVYYLGQVDSSVEIAILKSNDGLTFENTLKLQVGGNDLPQIDNASLDDAYVISIDGGVGVIKGTNPRSVLLGVYRFLRELGCRWVRPGVYGEVIPQVDLRDCSVHISEAASYRHRGVCIEGSCSFGHVKDMIDWLPKVGMNAYFMQFSTPFAFFDYWYRHTNNPLMETQPVSIEEVTAMVDVLAEQVKKRDLLYHATGHGWTCDPIGIRGLNWEKEEYSLTDEQRELLALVGGKRDVYKGVALNTNLCYSNPEAREKIVSAITDYCRERREVDYLHFWLADEANNHCECDGCKDVRPADYYVMMLNEIDLRLTTENIPTKIVFLVYFDLLWEPQTERLINKDRFTLMFAPITRSYSMPYYSGSGNASIELAPYSRNKLVMPKSVDENVARLRRWQELFSGDSFVFDYHLIWDHYYDPGGYESARILFEDMKNLDKLGLNGMISCQVQRTFFPTGLAMSAMAAALWDKEQNFEEFTEAYYMDLFGEYASEMSEHLKTLSKLFQPPYMRGELEEINAKSAGLFAASHRMLRKMSLRLAGRYKHEADPCRKRTWDAFIAHSQLCTCLADALSSKALGDQAKAEEYWEKVVEYANSIEPSFHDLFDVKYFTDVLGRAIKGERLFDDIT